MSAATFAVNFFVALFALIDPVGNVPLYAAATQGATPAGRRLTAVYIALFAFLFMAFFFLTGVGLLRFFGISLPAFRIAGGIVLLFMGLEMTRGDLTHSFEETGTGTEAQPVSTRAYASSDRARFPRPSSTRRRRGASAPAAFSSASRSSPPSASWWSPCSGSPTSFPGPSAGWG